MCCRMRIAEASHTSNACPAQPNGRDHSHKPPQRSSDRPVCHPRAFMPYSPSGQFSTGVASFPIMRRARIASTGLSREPPAVTRANGYGQNLRGVPDPRFARLFPMPPKKLTLTLPESSE